MKKSLSFLLSICLVLSLVLAAASPVFAKEDSEVANIIA